MSFLLRADVVVARICIACIAGRPTGMVIGSQNDRADAQRQVCGGMALSHALEQSPSIADRVCASGATTLPGSPGGFSSGVWIWASCPEPLAQRASDSSPRWKVAAPERWNRPSSALPAFCPLRRERARVRSMCRPLPHFVLFSHPFQ